MVGAELLLAAFGNAEPETDEEHDRQMAGAMLAYDAMLELTRIRMAFSPEK